MGRFLAFDWLLGALVLGTWSVVTPKPTAALTAGTSTAEELRAGTLTPEMVVSMRRIREVALSPDGRWAAYALEVPRSLDEDRGEPYAEIWLVDRKAHPRRFTPERQRAWAPAFSPDGTRLAFLSKRQIDGVEDDDKNTDLFLIDLAGGEASPLTRGEYAVEAFRWSPAGESIAFSAEQPRSDEEKKARKKGRDWVPAERELRPRLLWSVDVGARTVRRLTQTDVHVWGFDWAPDGARLVVQISDTPRADEWYLWSRLALVPAAGGAPVPFVRTVGKLDQPRFSPDGKHIAWLGAHDVNDPFPGTLFVAPLSGGAARALHANELGAATGIEWLDAATVAYATTRGTGTVLATRSLAGGAPRDILAQGPLFGRFALSADRKSLALVGDTPLHPNEVFVGTISRQRAAVRRVTTTNPEIERAQLGKQEVLRWKAADGLEIEGILVYPLGFTAGAHYPLVVQVHGGPEACYRNGWNTSYGNWSQLLSQRGYFVLMPNYRGSIGRGESFERADQRDLAGEEFQDILAGIDALVARGWVDPERVGIGGGSYGGYLSAWAATAHSERFAAAVDFAGITNWYSMQGQSDIPQENAFVHWNLPFYDNTEKYWERSPMAHVRKCTTPVLIAHGDNDRRVPVGQGVELYTALRLLGRDVELVRYPRAGHGLDEVAHQLDYLTRSLGWFEKHLGQSPEAAYR